MAIWNRIKNFCLFSVERLQWTLEPFEEKRGYSVSRQSSSLFLRRIFSLTCQRQHLHFRYDSLTFITYSHPVSTNWSLLKLLINSDVWLTYIHAILDWMPKRFVGILDFNIFECGLIFVDQIHFGTDFDSHGIALFVKTGVEHELWSSCIVHFRV